MESRPAQSSGAAGRLARLLDDNYFEWSSAKLRAGAGAGAATAAAVSSSSASSLASSERSREVEFHSFGAFAAECRPVVWSTNKCSSVRVQPTDDAEIER